MVGLILSGREDHQWPQPRRQRILVEGASLISPLDDQPKSGMKHAKYHLLVIVSFIISATLSYTCWQNLISSRLDIFGIHIQSSPKDELERALQRASMGNKTIMISVLNRAYANDGGLFDLFLEGFRKGENTSVLLNHLLLLAFDQKSYETCNRLHQHCYKVSVDDSDFSNELYYMSSGYLNMLWRKTQFLIQVLKRGYSFLFTDMDILWLRNPFDILKHEGDDFQFSCDTYTGKPYDENNPANIGFYLVVSNNKSIALFETLYAKRNNTGGRKQQDLLMEMKKKGVFRQLGLKVRYLDDRYIAGFCSIGRYNDKVRTIHANCCRGIKAKLIDLRLVLDEWEAFSNATLTNYKLKWPRHAECLHSWA